ncbi:MAG: aminodeoxychorismate/anthranilate synthase component II [Bacteroidetes bacterium]|nr:aminodeoxychorismate/anthranilate synthase component II [Bacteroidota bacterium]
MWVLLDNYDSFSHILHHYLLRSAPDCCVVRNDAISLSDLIDLNPSRLILSPGPGRPCDAGIMMAAIAHFHDKIPILGICLGHQAIGEFFGASLLYAPEPIHGKISLIRTEKHPLFSGLEQPMQAMRYHSLCLGNLKDTGLHAIAATEDGVNMGIAHEKFASIGFQAHPESIGTPQGLMILRNWAEMYIDPPDGATPHKLLS